MNVRFKKVIDELYSFIDYEKLLNSGNLIQTRQDDLDRFANFLERIGSPQDNYRKILVAGSKGKGSVCAMTEAVLRAQGYKTGLYTSPHLVNIRERIKIDGCCVNENLFIEELEKNIALAKQIGAEKKYRTVFEILTATAFSIFKKEQVDIALVEVGLGGRLDATNIIEPDITVITNLGIDHTNILGTTIEEITREKAGIIRLGIPLVTYPGSIKAEEIILEKLKTLKLEDFLFVDRNTIVNNVESNQKGTTFDIDNGYLSIKELMLALPGEIQIKNAIISLGIISMLNKQGIEISEESIRTGFKNVKWPGRMQIFQGEKTVVVDGAHSPMAIECICDSMRKIWPNEKIGVIFSANMDKDIRGMLYGLRDLSQEIILTRFDWPRVAQIDNLVEIAEEFEFEIKTAPDIKTAIKLALEDSCEIVLITGSLYLAGEALTELGFNPCAD